jgi:hypothetical protein
VRLAFISVDQRNDRFGIVGERDKREEFEKQVDESAGINCSYYERYFPFLNTTSVSYNVIGKWYIYNMIL